VGIEVLAGTRKGLFRLRSEDRRGVDARGHGGVDAPLAGGETLRIVQAVAGG
jgi:hypothetical protein